MNSLVIEARGVASVVRTTVVRRPDFVGLEPRSRCPRSNRRAALNMFRHGRMRFADAISQVTFARWQIENLRPYIIRGRLALWKESTDRQTSPMRI
jgi:hypothetical protein